MRIIKISQSDRNNIKMQNDSSLNISIPNDLNKFIDYQDFISVTFSFAIDYAHDGIRSIKLIPSGIVQINVDIEDVISSKAEKKLISIDMSKIKVYNEARSDEFDLITIGSTFITLDKNLNVDYGNSYIISLI